MVWRYVAEIPLNTLNTTFPPTHFGHVAKVAIELRHIMYEIPRHSSAVPSHRLEAYCSMLILCARGLYD